MKRQGWIALLFWALFYQSILGQGADYLPLDPSDPVIFFGDYFIYRGDTLIPGPRAFYVDGQLSDAEVARYPFVFNSVNEAARHLADGTENAPMTLYIAPYVYWIDNPDDPAVRVSSGNEPPYGLILQCDWLKFVGLSNRAENVVLACNRGQTIGAQGNFTMLKISGEGTSSENITFGNYCNVDLVYPLKPELNREKRAPAIVQAQLIHCNGDKIVARNTRFISRLNLCPFVGGKRVLFDRCHFESTDDALCGTAVYLNSTLEFYSSKPFYQAVGTGAVFLNCDITSFTRGEQYFTKANGQLAVVDTRIRTETADYFGWRDVPPEEMRNYQSKVTVNGRPIFISAKDSTVTVDMTGKPILNAYCVDVDGKTVYNTYNLLCGEDDWDPMAIKDTVLTAEKKDQKSYAMLPIQLLLSPTHVRIETGKDSIRLSAKAFRFGNFETPVGDIRWAVAPESESLVQLNVSRDGTTCAVYPKNETDETRDVVIFAQTSSGLEAASVLTVAPAMLEPPVFKTLPQIIKKDDGKLFVDYALDTHFTDQSLVTWSRCTNAKGRAPIEVAVSRFDAPLREYELSAGDVGYYIRVSVAPKHMRCHVGKPAVSVLPDPIKPADVKTDTHLLHTNFRNISTKNQPEIIPGFWTWDHLNAKDFGRWAPEAKEGDAWFYGDGSSGSAGRFGLLQTGRSASMLYTPVEKSGGNMRLEMSVAPFKTAGQGFSVAGMYMDVLIQFDTKTMTGYGLRLIRTTQYHDAVDCYFVRYQDGAVTQISEPVSTPCYRTPCRIVLQTMDGKLTAHMETSAEYYREPDPQVMPVVNMETEMTPADFGGFGIRFNGGASSMIEELSVEWNDN